MSISGLHIYQGYSLVDITATGVIRSTGQYNLERDQQRNWETVLQCIGLRTQPQHIQGPVTVNEKLEEFRFGEFYSGTQRVWMWTWAVEASGIYDLNNESLAGLYKDFEQVPIITGLSESARFMLPIFYPYGAIKNIYFTQLESR